MKNLIISKGQFLSDVISEIPSNAIIYKNITGIGATTLELLSKRHSIIIEPNVPVIIKKCITHTNALAVYKDVSAKKVEKYLNDTSIEYKKLIVTPESYIKIVEATWFNQTPYNIYNDFFVLFDECDKVTKDIDYRVSIQNPLVYFFEHKNRAFISATAVRPSDLRFQEHNFEEISILPDYEIAKSINLYTTNNVYELCNKLMHETKNKKFIFFNSTRGIEKVISLLKIKSNSAIYCSENALDGIDGNVSAYTEIDEETFKAFNFFTCRFFTAVDINIDCDADIYILTDLNIAEHSVVDPHSDVIQIIGRFRNKQYNTNISVITNFDENLVCKSIEDSESFLNCAERIYNRLSQYERTTTNKGLKELFKIIQKAVPFNDFLDDYGKKSYFLCDNYMYHNRVKHYYLKEESIVEVYKNTCILDTDISYFDVNHISNPFYISSNDIVQGKIFKSYRSRIKDFTQMIKSYEASKDNLDSLRIYRDIYKSYKFYYPELIKILDNGLMSELGDCHTKKDVERLIRAKEIETERSDLQFIDELRNILPIGSKYEGKELRELFGNLIKKHGLSIRASIEEARNFMDISERRKDKGGWKYVILDHL